METDDATIPGLPPQDRRLSPATGWTRAHHAAVADGLLAAALRFRSPGGGRIDLPGPPSASGVTSDGLEGFARTFLLAATRLAGEGGADPHGLADAYAEGLVSGPRHAGTDHPDGWYRVRTDGPAGQAMVEAASVAIGLLLSRPWTWERLDGAEQDRLEGWLRDALLGDPAPNNWYWFPASVATFLEAVGRGDELTARARERAEELAEGWYVGDGWYRDGDARAFDHYGGWAMHLYPVLLAHLAGDARRLTALGPRLEEFLGSYAATFDADGAPLHQGRSLTYRWATLAPVALGELVGRTPLRPGQSRRLMSGALRYFLDRGALRDGLLTLGWHGPHAPTLQRYSGPASPYWASKGFLGLLLPASAPLWRDVEEDPPAAGPDRTVPVPSVGWLVQTTRADGLVRVHNHGSDAVREGAGAGVPDPLYARLAYSTRTGPTSRGSTPDNHVRLVHRGTGSGRRRIHPLGAGPGWAASWHRPVPGGDGHPLPQARITSAVLAHGRWEVHVHHLAAVPAGTPVVVSGWPLAAAGPWAIRQDVDDRGARLAADGLTAQLVALSGWDGARVVRAPHGTAYGAWALVPELVAAAGDGLLVSASSLTGADPADAPPAAEVEGRRVTVGWPDGSRTACTVGDAQVRVEQPATAGPPDGR
ncbi:DUF2264 domain-containing protein [Pseudokineococcus basanitobsidens]|uniref:DUF2264 domain-containing protein n=1 Tax=Pseudokineococcus basanitobsidens TaxID=1926649 RepID=A0ABU8RNA8_9ACTN